MKRLKTLGALMAGLLISAIVGAQGATVLYNERVVEVATTLPDATDLWVTPEDLTQINDFVLKPEGAVSMSSAFQYYRIGIARCLCGARVRPGSM